nr:hypothetical protein 18 [bacterium]
MAGFSLTPNPPYTDDKQWKDLVEKVKSIPGVTSSRRERPNQVWVATSMSKKELADALNAAGIPGSLN